jgi:hypothetical protein
MFACAFQRAERTVVTMSEISQPRTMTVAKYLDFDARRP